MSELANVTASVGGDAAPSRFSRVIADARPRASAEDSTESSTMLDLSAKAVIYARFSSDLQRDTSVIDQERYCRQRAVQLGIEVTDVITDAAVSGTMRLTEREGGARLLALARARETDCILLEGLDRLARDSVEQETVVRMFEHWGVRLIGTADGYDSTSGAMRKLTRGIRGLINETYLEDLKHKVRRGQIGQIKRGFSPGGTSYGYRSIVAETNARGEAVAFRVIVVDDEARIVQRIFREFVNGKSCTTIAHELNDEGIPSPSGRKW